jgi:3-isopropylmalate/(R)-2-methylmalate dehydratase small subunit
MQAFTTLTAIAAPLPLPNIDTDMIIPKQFLKTIKRTGLGVHLFDEMRYTLEGAEIPEFVLNQAPYHNAGVLIAGENFGCGSSREHAPWALLDFGLHCIIAPSFADIFYNNCFKNGILPIRLAKSAVDELLELAKNQPENPLSIDLEKQEIRAWNKVYRFEIDTFRKQCLLKGLDDIGQTLQKTNAIDAFETTQQQTKPWLSIAS